MGFPRISCELKIERPLQLGEEFAVEVRLQKADGKRVFYRFRIVDADEKLVVSGDIVAALCRFPDGKPPYAILFPPGLKEKLTADAVK
jgi:acyl-CoA thioesterase FadM